MEQTTKDRALLRALAPKESRQLPSNFPYLTMHRIKEKQRREEHRQHLIAIVTSVTISLVGISTILFLLWDTFKHAFSSIFHQPDGIVFVLPTLFCLLFFVIVNHWLSRRYNTC